MTKKGAVGFVSIVGRPNVGKSTLTNAILGYHLSAVTSRPHTTRKRWLGIYSTQNTQIIFVDTPGIHQVRNKLYEYMTNTITNSLKDNDVTLVLADAYREFGDEDMMLIKAVKQVKKPTVLALNKIDIATEEQITATQKIYSQHLGEIPTFLISSLQKEGVEPLLEHLQSLLPQQSPFLFDPEQIADVHLRDIASELIRESIIERLIAEVPHSIAVEIEKWQENNKKIKINAIVYVERDSQKAILIGKGGSMIDKVKRDAVTKLKENFAKFIDLRFYIKVMPKWQNNTSFLKQLGLKDG